MSNNTIFFISRKEFFVSLVEIFTLAICVLFSNLPIASFVAVFVLCVFLIRILNKHAIFYIKYLAVLFSVISLMVGCLLIEFTDIYLTEIQSYSKFVGSIPLLSLSFWVLLKTIYLIDSKSKVSFPSEPLKIKRNSTRNAITMVSIVVFIAFFAQFISIAPHPAFVVGLERSAYSAVYLTNPVLNTLYNYSILLVVIPILLIVNDKGWRRYLGFACVLLNILNAIWMGNKFGSFLQLLEIVLIVFSGSMSSNLTNKKIKKYAGISLISLVILILSACIIKSFNSESIVENYLSNRVASQSELWWKIYSLYDGDFHLQNFPNEIKSFFTANDIISENIGANYGIYNVMYLTSSKNIVNAMLKSGYRYSQAGYAAMYYYFGYIGPILYSLIFGFITAKTTNRLIKALDSGLIIETFIYIRLLIFTYSAFANFIFNFYFSTLTILTYMYLIFFRGKRLKFRRN